MATAKPKRTRGKTPDAPRPRGAAGSVLGRGDLATSLLFAFPLFLAYEIGVMFTSTANGVDYVTRWLYQAVGYSRRNYLLVHAVLAVAFVVLLVVLRRRRKFALRSFGPMVLESAIYALTLGSFIIFVMRRVLGLGLAPGALGETGEALIASVGAGVHEELVFRLGMLAGLAYGLRALGVSHRWAVLVAAVVSSLVFSAAHHIGPYGEPWTTDAFVYRALAGGLFGAIFYYRSLAHAVYTHFLYDVYVLLIHP